MSFFENAGLKLLRLSNPEFAHNIAIKSLNLRLAPKPETLVFENLKKGIRIKSYCWSSRPLEFPFLTRPHGGRPPAFVGTE